jgi:outer membrane lipoprotein-sorting protein
MNNVVRRIPVISLIIFLLSISAFSQVQQQPTGQSGDKTTPGTNTSVIITQTANSTPTVDQIIERYVQAIGGAALAQKQTSLVTKGTFEMPESNIKGTIEAYAKAPNKLMLSLKSNDEEIFVIQGYDGLMGWERRLISNESRIALKQMQGAELADFKMRAEFNREIRLKELYPKMTLKGKEKVDEAEAYVIEATPAGGGDPVKMYFDTGSGLLVREDSTSPTPDGKTTVETYYDDYREVNGLKMPYTVSSVYPNPALNSIIRFTEVRHNEAIPDTSFQMPKK